MVLQNSILQVITQELINHFELYQLLENGDNEEDEQMELGQFEDADPEH